MGKSTKVLSCADMPRLDAPDDHQSRFLSNMASGELDAFRCACEVSWSTQQKHPF